MSTTQPKKKRRRRRHISDEQRLVNQIPKALEAVVAGVHAYDTRQKNILLDRVGEQAITEASVLLVVRLLFVLYAESHQMLPLNTASYRQQVSLQVLVTQVFSESRSPGDGHERLRRLFNCIYSGSEGFDFDLCAHGGRLFDLGLDALMGPDSELFFSDDEIRSILSPLLILGSEGNSVDYAALEAEQLGHLYEVLLQYRVVFDSENKAWQVRSGTKRRATGSHYTPRALTEPIVAHTLRPLLPTEGTPTQRARAILSLKVCDMAMGAGAFLMAATRYLSEHLLACWEEAESAFPLLPVAMPDGVPATSVQNAHVLPGSGTLLRGPELQEARRMWARRYVAERCVYGVDRNPLAVEMARMSLWLLTFSKDLPFSGLDHNLKNGDSILGVDQRQLLTLSLEREGPAQRYLFDAPVQPLVRAAVAQRELLATSPLRTQQDVENRQHFRETADRAMDLLRLLGNVLVASHFGSGGKRAYLKRREQARMQTFEVFEEWKRLGEGGVKYFNTKEKVESDLFGRQPLHWPVAFPEIFLGQEEGGFDAIIGNPPFGNAIEKPTGRDVDTRLFFQSCFPETAQGAYDLCNLFIVAAVRHLKPGGRYGLVQPRSNLSQRSAMATQRFVQEKAPLQMLLAFDDAQLFSGASVYVACVIGSRLGPEQGGSGLEPVRVFVEGDILDVENMPKFIPGRGEPWWSLVTQKDRPQLTLRQDLVPLRDLVTVHAGCATGAAYDLREILEDDKEAAGARLITTGLIDRYTFLWGTREVRYLKGKFSYPRWPEDNPSVPKSVLSALRRQAGPKVLVGGLSRRIEAVADLKGQYAGVVSTWVVLPREDNLPIQIIAALLSSWIFSFEYMRLFGAKRMGDGNWTIGRQELQDTLVPRDLLNPAFIRDLLALLDEQGAPRDAASEFAIQHRIAQAYGVELGQIELLKGWYFQR